MVNSNDEREEEEEEEPILLVPPGSCEGQFPLHLHRTLGRVDGKVSTCVDRRYGETQKLKSSRFLPAFV